MERKNTWLKINIKPEEIVTVSGKNALLVKLRGDLEGFLMWIPAKLWSRKNEGENEVTEAFFRPDFSFTVFKETQVPESGDYVRTVEMTKSGKYLYETYTGQVHDDEE